MRSLGGTAACGSSQSTKLQQRGRGPLRTPSSPGLAVQCSGAAQQQQRRQETGEAVPAASSAVGGGEFAGERACILFECESANFCLL